jgi:hypothetical protein
MWIGRGVDTNSDGETDFIVGYRPPPMSDQEFLKGCMTAIGFWTLVIAGCFLFFRGEEIYRTVQAEVVKGITPFFSWLWAWFVAIVFWSFVSAVLAASALFLFLGFASTAKRSADGSRSAPSMTTLDDKIASDLAKTKTPLRLSGVTAITDSVARKLAMHRGGFINLSGLSVIADPVAAAFVGHTGGLYLDGIRVVSPAAAGYLARHEGLLSLNGLRELSAPVATALARCKGSLSLNGLSALSLGAALALARYEGDRLSLTNLVSVPPQAVALLTANPAIHLSPKFRRQ